MLTIEEKEEIHGFIGNIRRIIDQADIDIGKKERVFSILSELALEVDRDRSRFERLADATRRLAGLSGEVEEKGARPWFKYVKAVWGVFDKAKEDELQRLPKPPEQKRLPPPTGAKQVPPDSGDEIPF